MKVYTANDIWKAAREEYPNAQIFPHDRDRHLLTRKGWQNMSQEFWFQLRNEGIYEYGMGFGQDASLSGSFNNDSQRFEVNDCDDFGIHMMSYLRKRHAKTKDVRHALGFMCMHYLVEGNPNRGHFILVPFLEEDGVLVARALEPQPNGGIFRCTDTERFSASLLFG